MKLPWDKVPVEVVAQVICRRELLPDAERMVRARLAGMGAQDVVVTQYSDSDVLLRRGVEVNGVGICPTPRWRVAMVVWRRRAYTISHWRRIRREEEEELCRDRERDRDPE